VVECLPSKHKAEFKTPVLLKEGKKERRKEGKDGERYSKQIEPESKQE
jgi:hypothetical protein